MRLPVLRRLELATGLVADGGQPRLVREGGAVGNYGVVGTAVAEAAGLVHFKAEPQRVARPERPLEGIDPVTEICVPENESGGSVEGHGSGLGVRDGGYVDGVDGG